jgi:hypothetical protein
VIGDYFHAEIEMYPFNGYGIGSPKENSTIFKALVDGIVDVTGPDSSFLTERIANLPKHSSPIGFNSMVAIIKRRSAATGANDIFGIEKRFTTLLTILGLFLLIYVVRRFILRQSLGRFSILLINLFAIFYWIFVYVCMNYIVSDLSIGLFDATPRPLPFEDFEQMVESVEGGKIQLVAIKGSATEKLLRPSLEQAQESSTAMKFYKADAKGKLSQYKSNNAKPVIRLALALQFPKRGLGEKGKC